MRGSSGADRSWCGTLRLSAAAANLGNDDGGDRQYPQRGAQPPRGSPKTAEPWSLTSLGKKLVKIGAKVVSHGRYVTFQLAEVAVPRQMVAEILSLIARLWAPPAPA